MDNKILDLFLRGYVLKKDQGVRGETCQRDNDRMKHTTKPLQTEVRYKRRNI